MTSTRVYAPLLGLLFAVLQVGCATTELSTVWTRPDYAGPPASRIMIVALTDKAYNRHLYEDSFVKTLQQHGIYAVASRTLITDLNAGHNRDEIRSTVQRAGFDAILVATLESVDVVAQETSTPPVYRPLQGGEETYSQYWGKTITQSGYAVTKTTVKLKTSLFSTQTEKMIWQGRTQSFNPGSKQQVIDQNTRLITDHLLQTGFLQQP